MGRSIFDLDRLALRAARDLSARSPRADLTIVQLPILVAPASSDTIPVYHLGETYQATVSSLVSGGIPNPKEGKAIVAADGLNTTGPTQVTFTTPYPTACLGAIVTVDFGAGLVYGISANAGALTAAGFQIVAFGNPNAFSQCVVYWLTWGN